MALRMAMFALMAIGLLGFGAVAWISTWPATPPPAPIVAALPAAVIAPPPPPVQKTSVLVASHQLRAGSFIKGEDLRAQEFALGQAPKGAALDTPAARSGMNGAMVRHGLGEGQVIVADDFLRAADHGFLAAVLEPGMRAMTFNAADVTTDWALIWPGDHVDVILTGQFDDVAVSSRGHIAAETIIHDARVIAVDRQLVQGETVDDADRKPTRTLTVELSPADSEHLLVAERIGKITLVLRSAATPGNQAERSNTAAVTWGGDVAHALDHPPAPEALTVRVFGGAGDGREFKF